MNYLLTVAIAKLALTPDHSVATMSKDFSPSSFPQLETERLLLRETSLHDAEATFAVFSDPSVTQFHDLDTFTSIKEAMSTAGYAYAIIERSVLTK
ncbi:GNAT family N-acetyltransferase [Nostoc sp.]|uniref:GNAT family N-acetyltransferase n=1 Tax=Nostoc sp. TaxID=1180 RepID=UPI002FF504F2